MSIEHYGVPSPIVCGAGALRELAVVAKRSGITRPLLVTDAGIRACGLLDRTVRALRKRGEQAPIFDGVSSNCTEDDVYAGLRIYRQADADGLVAVGGGSALDTAKGIRLLASHDGRIPDYDLLQGGMARIVNDMPPLIAVPTTAGTGSEVSRGALIVTRVDDVIRKTIVASPRLVPSWAILDGELTVSLPPALTAGTGMDALSHCVEEYVSPRYHPTVGAIAYSGLRRIARDLPKVWSEPDDVDARSEMLVSAMMGGIGFEKGLGAVHSMAHAIGALHDVHHGRLCATLLPHGMEFNAEHLAPNAAVELAAAIGQDCSDDADALQVFVDWLRALNDRFEIPARLRDLDVPEHDRHRIVTNAFADHCHRTNPRPCAKEDIDELWERAF